MKHDNISRMAVEISDDTLIRYLDRTHLQSLIPDRAPAHRADAIMDLLADERYQYDIYVEDGVARLWVAGKHVASWAAM